MEGRETKPPPPNPAMPYREDCWSEGATAALIEAWGDRYVELNRGNLRQKHWQEVADSVNCRRGAARRPPRTDVQCKNRIDTLKKKYKIEKAKIGSSGVSSDSQWPFYSRLDTLIGDSVSAKKPPPPPPHPPSPPLALPLPFHRKGSPLPAAAAAAAAAAARSVDPKEKRPAATALPVDDAFFRRNYSAAAAAAAERGSESSSSRSSVERSRSSRERFAKGWKKRRQGDGEGFRQLAKAIVRMAEIYEKVEEDKQQLMMELEKQRMEFAKGLEFQRMQIFVDSQVQLEKIKRSKRFDAGEHESSLAAIRFLLGSAVLSV